MSDACSELDAAIWQVLSGQPDMETGKVITAVTAILVRRPGWSAHDGTNPRGARPAYLTHDSERESESIDRCWIRDSVAAVRKAVMATRCHACGQVLP